MKTKLQRISALALSLCLAMTLVPTAAFAEETQPDSGIAAAAPAPLPAAEGAALPVAPAEPETPAEPERRPDYAVHFYYVVPENIPNAVPAPAGIAAPEGKESDSGFRILRPDPFHGTGDIPDGYAFRGWYDEADCMGQEVRYWHNVTSMRHEFYGYWTYTAPVTKAEITVWNYYGSEADPLQDPSKTCERDTSDQSVTAAHVEALRTAKEGYHNTGYEIYCYDSANQPVGEAVYEIDGALNLSGVQTVRIHLKYDLDVPTPTPTPTPIPTPLPPVDDDDDDDDRPDPAPEATVTPEPSPAPEATVTPEPSPAPEVTVTPEPEALIEEEEIPLAEAPAELPPALPAVPVGEDTVTIVDENAPLGALPQTGTLAAPGDNTNTPAMLTLAAALMLAGLGLRPRRKQGEE